MPRVSVPIVLDGKVVGIGCYTERRRNCWTCSATRSSLTCDGCDHVLCTACAVSPVQGLDFCPRCFEPAFEHWKALSLNLVPSSRPERRQAFRLWARESANAVLFLQLSKPRTKKSRREVPSCSSCGAEVTWAVTEHDKPMPVDVTPVENGNLVLEQPADPRQPPVARYVEPGRGTHVSHFATCPQAAAHRKATK